jgi:hypothetical protein
MISHGVWAGVVQDEHWTRLGVLLLWSKALAIWDGEQK